MDRCFNNWELPNFPGLARWPQSFEIEQCNIFWTNSMQCGYCKLIPQKYQFVSFFNVKLCEIAWNARFDICGSYVRRSNAWISNHHFISFHHADNLHYNELQIHPLTKFYPAFRFKSSRCIFSALCSSCRSQYLWPPQVKNLIC